MTDNKPVLFLDVEDRLKARQRRIPNSAKVLQVQKYDPKAHRF